MQRALINSLELYVLHYPCFMQSLISSPTCIFGLHQEVVKCYLFKIMARSVRAQVMQTGEVNKVLIKRVPSSRFAFHSCTELVVMMAA